MTVLPVNCTSACLISCAPFFLASAAVPVPRSLTSSRLGLRFRFHAASLLPGPGCGSGSMQAHCRAERAGNTLQYEKALKTFLSSGLHFVKEGGFLLSRIALQYHRRKWA